MLMLTAFFTEMGIFQCNDSHQAKSQAGGETKTKPKHRFIYFNLLVSIKPSHREIFQTRLEFKSKSQQNTLKQNRGS